MGVDMSEAKVFGECDVCGEEAKYWWGGTNVKLCRDPKCDEIHSALYVDHCRQCNENDRLERERLEEYGS